MQSERPLRLTPERPRWEEDRPEGSGDVDKVRIELKLTIAEQSYVIWGFNVERLALRMTRFGLSGEIDFWIQNDEDQDGEEVDELYAAFGKSDPIEIELGIIAVRPDDEEENTISQKDPVPLVIKGLVSEREVYEETYRGMDTPAPLCRRYRVAFLDPAALLWRQHHPLELYTEKTLQEVIEANKVAPITVNYEGESLTTTKKALLFLGLSPVERGAASFYDWLIWLCDSRDLVFTYKYSDQSYRLAEQPEEPPTEKVALARLDIDRVCVRHAEVARVQARVRNGYSGDPRTTVIAAASALAPLSRDYLIRAPIGADLDGRGTLETQRLRGLGPRVHIDFAKLPLRLFGPGDHIDLQTEVAAWKAAGVVLPTEATGAALRCVSLVLSMQREGALRQRTGIGHEGAFRLRCRAEFEAESERAPRLPDYVTPQYPRLVEGLVQSGAEEGGDGEAGSGGAGGGGGKEEEVEETYEIESDEQTSLQRYKVKLPLFTDQVVRVPFDPGMLSGHFYFPIYKNARVLVALDCERATLRALLDWRIGNQLPLESQGNQLMMGKKLSSSVILQTVYEDEKVVFTLQRKSDKDTQTVRIAEGKLSVFVGEGTDGTAAEKIKTTTISIDKTAGVLCKVEDPDNKLTQTVTLDGANLILQVQGEEQTSTYTQTADAITIKAKTLTVEGETLTMKTTKASAWTSEDTLSITSTKDMSLTSSAALSQKADKAGSLEAESLSIKATNAATVEGSDTTVKGSSSLKGEAPSVTLDGSSSTTVKGASVEVSASASLTCKSSATTTVKGAMVTISGSLIQVG